MDHSVTLKRSTLAKLELGQALQAARRYSPEEPRGFHVAGLSERLETIRRVVSDGRLADPTGVSRYRSHVRGQPSL